jgi:hypothetical protein
MFFIIVVVLGAIITAFFMMGSDDGAAEGKKAVSGEEGAQEAQAEDSVQENPKEAAVVDANAEEEEEVPDTEAVVEKPVEAKAPQSDPSSIQGLTGWYDGSSWDEKANQWKDKSGQNNHVVEVRGEIEVDSDESSNNQKFIFGSTQAGLRFPQGAMSTGRKYTLVHVAKYAGSTQGRIFQGTNNSFISGFKSGHTGTAHRAGSGYIAHWDNEGQDRFIVHVDQKHLLRKDGLRRSGLTNFSALIPSQLTINYGQVDAENSDWAAAEVLIFNRELSTEEIRKLENYLMRKYKIMKKVRAGVRMLNVSKAGNNFDSINGIGSDCGDEGVLYFNRLQLLSGGTRRRFDSACIQGLEGGVTEKRTSYTSKEGKWFDAMEKMPIDCGDKAISGFNFEESNDKTKVRVKYACHGHGLNLASCTEQSTITAGDGTQDRDLNESLNMAATNCGANKAMTSLRLEKGDDGRLNMKYKCCNLEDM